MMELLGQLEHLNTAREYLFSRRNTNSSICCMEVVNHPSGVNHFQYDGTLGQNGNN